MEERRESEDLKFPHLLCSPTCFSGSLGYWVPRECLLDLEAEVSGEYWEGSLEGNCGIYWKWEQAGGGSQEIV